MEEAPHGAAEGMQWRGTMPSQGKTHPDAALARPLASPVTPHSPVPGSQCPRERMQEESDA